LWKRRQFASSTSAQTSRIKHFAVQACRFRPLALSQRQRKDTKAGSGDHVAFQDGYRTDVRMTDNQKVDARHDAIRQARLAASLRENLKRRKAQSRGRVSDEQKIQPVSAIESLSATPEGRS
jgi:hypothetical protein